MYISTYSYKYIHSELCLGLALSVVSPWFLIATSRNDLLDRTGLEADRRVARQSKTPSTFWLRGKEEALRVSLI